MTSDFIAGLYRSIAPSAGDTNTLEPAVMLESCYYDVTSFYYCFLTDWEGEDAFNSVQLIEWGETQVCESEKEHYLWSFLDY